MTGQRSHHLAQVSVARMRAPVWSPVMRPFVTAVDRINALAEASPGFVWRDQLDAGHGFADDGDGDRVIVNLSVWETYGHLHDFIYRSDHARFVRRRSEWFEPLLGPTTVLWWVPVGTVPTFSDARGRLQHVRRHGPMPAAFTLRVRFDEQGRRIRDATRSPQDAVDTG